MCLRCLAVLASCPAFACCCRSYKIHYPGWADEWDEWVTRDRLRWPVDNSYLSTDFKARDYVEVWCTGTHVKGAWLQARVRQVGVTGSLSHALCRQLSDLPSLELRWFWQRNNIEYNRGGWGSSASCSEMNSICT